MELDAESEYEGEYSDNDDPDFSNRDTEVEVDANSEENDEDELGPVESTFDLGLPVLHSYLGQNLEELRGRTILDDGIYMNLPLLPRDFVVLFPGQTLPMTVFHRETINMIQNCIESNRTFGVVCMSDNIIVPIGTTAEIYEYKQKSSMQGLCLKAKGRQRFKILRVIMQGYDKISANVKIVPEITLGPPLYEQRLVSLDRCRIKAVSEEDLKHREKIENMEAMLSPWPAWVYRQYDAMRLSLRIKKLLRFMETNGCVIPSDPTELSFWVAQNLLLDNKQRVVILNYDCAISRLQQEITYLTEDKAYVCRLCNVFIGLQSDMFAMSKEGPQGAYCNPGGALHETVTMHHARGLKLYGNQGSTHCSWFPGYAWIIANCKNCGTHMGWKFVAVDSNLKPKSFWGLLRKCLKDQQPV